MKTKLIVSRQWHEPEIEAYVTKTEVGSKMDLDDFITALVEEVGNPTMLVSKTALKEKLHSAALAIVADMKDKTKFVV